MDGTPINACNGFFTDSGGNGGGYGPNESFTTTICTDGTNGTHVQLAFPSVFLGAGETLCFYDGNDATAPLLACAADFPVGGSFIMQATAVNPGGCLTVVFNSDGTDEAEGWNADINCIAACQLITSQIVGSIPAIMPADTGYIDICPGDGIEFFGAGLYPQDGAVYSHSDATSNFFWSFGDGTTAEGPNVFKVFDEPGGYTVQLRIMDQFNCRNTNFISQRVRVSTYPSFGISDMIPGVICSGDTVTLVASIGSQDSTAELSVGANTGSFQNEGAVSDSLALPDGNGASYSTSISFTEFSPGQVLSDVDDFLGVCLIMEHSWMFDLDIFLTCPDGTTVILQDQEQIGQQVFLGTPNESDDGSPSDPPLQGVGAEYCFTADAPNPTWTTYATSNGVGSLPSGDYSSFDPLSNFLGCPLNGEWELTVIDQWASDNGWIFEWSIGFSEDLFPNLETFTPIITDLNWQDQNSIIFYEPDSIIASPLAAGNAAFTVDVMDNFGCVYDTTILIDVLPVTHPDCYNCIEAATFMEDTTTCVGSSVTISAIPPDTIAPESVSFFAFSGEPLEFIDYPPALPLEVPLEVDYVFPTSITSGDLQILSVCVNLDHKAAGDVELRLQSPAGTIIELSTNNGDLANDYISTCFTASAPTVITAGSPPFTGDFQPEESFAAFDGENLLGTWTLLVADASNGFRGVMKDWTITFAIENELSYQWPPSPDLSCTICPDPEITPSSFPATYTIEIVDDFGCVLRDTIMITETTGFPAPVVSCTPNTNTSITFNWTDIGAAAYEISTDGGINWFVPDALLSHRFDGLLVGETITLMVRAVALADCPSDIATTTCSAAPCELVLDTLSTQRPSCVGDTDGAASLTSIDGTAPIEYFVNGNGPFTDQITGLGAGTQEIIAIDAAGCRDTITFDLASLSTPIGLTTSVDSVQCNGEATGMAEVIASGGFGMFSYEWNTTPVNTTSTATLLSAGTYTVVVTDEAGCTNEAMVVVEEPAELLVTLDTVGISCNAADDGQAMLTGMGGTLPYTYTWSTGETTPILTNLGENPTTGTLTDANGCSAALTVALTEPALLTLDLLPENLSCFGNASGQIQAMPENINGTANYSWSGPNSFNATTGMISDLVAGEYCVTITDNNACEIIDCVTLIEPVAIDLSQSSTPASCFNTPTGSGLVTASGGAGDFTYAWNDDNNQVTAEAIDLNPGDYLVTVTDVNNCTATIGVTVENGTSIGLTFNSTPPLCSDSQDGTAIAMATGGAGSFTYQWDAPAGNQNTDVAINLIAGTYCVTATDINGCTINDCVEVFPINALEIMEIVSTPASCFGVNDGTAAVNVAGGAGGYMYLWDDENAQFSNPAVSLPAGTYAVTVTDVNGCQTDDVITVVQPDTLVGVLTPTAVACFGDNTGQATSMVTGGTTPYTYSWNDGQITANAANLPMGNAIVTITDANGCTDIQSTEIIQPATPLSITVAQGDTSCFELDASTAIAMAAGGTPLSGYQYSWDNGGGTAALASDLAATTYTVMVTDNNGCTETASLSIEEYTPLAINLIPVDPSCFGTEDGGMAVNIISRGGMLDDLTTYTFDWSTGGTGMDIQNLAGEMTYSITATDSRGCVGDTSLLITSPERISLNVAVADPACAGDENGTLDIVNVSGGNDNFTYLWNNNSVDARIEDLSAGSYRVTVTDDEGCTTDSLFVLTAPDPLSARFDVDPSGCQGSDIGRISAEISGGTAGYNFDWSNGESSTTINELASGTYSLILTDAQGCQLFDTLFIGQPDPIVAAYDITDPDCNGGRDGRVEINVTGGVGPFEYSVNDGAFRGSSTLIALEAGTYQVQIQDQSNCILTDSITVTDPPAFTVFAGDDLPLIVGDSIQLDPTFINNVGTVQLNWSADFEGTLFCEVDTLPCIDPWVQTLFSNTYELYGVDENGCEDTDEIEIKIDKASHIFVPTAFTPNRDGSNDLLTVHGVAGAKVISFTVYDRWGTRVFASGGFDINDTNIGWNGRYRGEASATGVYTWKVEASFLDGQRKLVSGHSTLLR